MRKIILRPFFQKGIIVPLAICMLMAVSSLGQYEIGWFTIDGGGRQSAGGQYILTGTIGQPDAAYSASDNYELLGGFWPGGPLCFVDFEDFARFALYWLETGSGLAGDLDADSDVDFADLSRFTEEWLYYCPYNWPLR